MIEIEMYERVKGGGTNGWSGWGDEGDDKG